MIFDKQKGKLPMPDQPKLTLPRPESMSQPPAGYAPRSSVRRDLAEAAAAAEQRWIDLENALAYEKDLNSSLHAELKVAAETVRAQKLELERCKAEADQLVKDNAIIHTKLGLACHILLSIRGDDHRLDAAIKKANEALSEAVREMPPVSEQSTDPQEPLHSDHERSDR